MKKEKNRPSIVVLGGGTGLAVLLRGLKNHTKNLTAIVNVTDDGGSSGKLRRELGVLPPGDIRNCLVALSEEENLMAKLFQYRFPSDGSLSGHSFGNLFLTAMSSIAGGFDSGIARAGEVLAICGKVLPVTLSSVTLRAKLKNGKTVEGETNIAKSESPIESLIISPMSPPPGPKVIESILSADAVVIGPGSLYTSIVSNLLVSGVVSAIKKSRAPKIYVSNLMTQPMETKSYNLGDHLKAIEKYLGKNVIDYVIVNSRKIKGSILKRYSSQDSEPVVTDRKHINGAALVKEQVASFSGGLIRHDSDKLAKAILKLINEKKK
jgi:uncharacterized cofD-like protein